MRRWPRLKNRDRHGPDPLPARLLRPTVLVVLAHDQDVSTWRQRHARGEVLDQTPYGYDRADRFFDLRWAVSAQEGTLGRKVRVRIATWAGFDLVHVWRNRALVREADLIWTHTEREHLAVAAIQMATVRRRRVPVLAQSVWLWDEWPNLGRARRTMTAALLRRQPIELVLSRVNLAISQTAVPGRRVELAPFGSAGLPGVGVEESDQVRHGPPTVLAIGNDRHRDWPLLAAVAERMPDVQFRVASSSAAARRVSWPENVTLASARSGQELAELYRSSWAVAVVVTENAHASGITTVIEAAGARRPLVATDAGGLADYAPKETALVRSGDALDLERALRAALRGQVRPAAPGSMTTMGLTQGDYVSRYVLVSWWLLGQHDWDPDISRFEQVDLFSS